MGTVGNGLDRSGYNPTYLFAFSYRKRKFSPFTYKKVAAIGGTVKTVPYEKTRAQPTNQNLQAP